MKKYLQAYLKEKPIFFSFVRPKEASLYQQFLPFMRPVLDVGCGDGFFAQVGFDSVDVGIDPDRGAIEEAKKRKVYKTVKYYNGKKIPYPDNYFSTVVCNSTFEHITNLSEVLCEVSRVIKKGGKLYFTVPTNLWPNYLFGRLLLGKFYESFFVNKSKHYNMYTFLQWEKLLLDLGFKVIYGQHYLDNKKAMWLFDMAHYISAPALITKKIFNRWVIFPEKVKFLGSIENFLIDQTAKNNKKGPYLFIAAKKIN